MKSNQKSVYVLQSASGLVKVGVSGNLHQRISALEQASGLKITKSISFPPSSVSFLVEKKSHELLSKYRQVGEWFSCSFDGAVRAVKRALKDKAIKAAELKSEERVTLDTESSVALLARVCFGRDSKTGEYIGRDDEEFASYQKMVAEAKMLGDLAFSGAGYILEPGNYVVRTVDDLCPLQSFETAEDMFVSLAVGQAKFCLEEGLDPVEHGIDIPAWHVSGSASGEFWKLAPSGPALILSAIQYVRNGLDGSALNEQVRLELRRHQAALIEEIHLLSA